VEYQVSGEFKNHGSRVSAPGNIGATPMELDRTEAKGHIAKMCPNKSKLNPETPSSTNANMEHVNLIEVNNKKRERLLRGKEKI
ncbi:1293_t:CDS:2, partial [Racocetra fulgida]